MSESPPVDAALAEILQPLRDQAAAAAERIAALETQLDAERATLRRIDKVLRAADPNAARPGPKPAKGSRSGMGGSVSDEAVEKVLTYLQANLNGDEFHATGVWREADLGMSSHTVNAALHVLRERGLIRLAKRGTGGSRIYRMV
jgi:hypothetical protein